MRVAVIGATGRIGSLTVQALERDGHEAVQVSRSLGVDLFDADSVRQALDGVDAVIDSSNTAITDPAELVEFFRSSTTNLLAAERDLGIGHHVLLSIVGIDRGQRSDHYDGKREQERLVTESDVPWSIVRATQFHDFAAMVAGWTAQDGVATIAPLLVQPVAPSDVADTLAEVATAAPLRRRIDLAGPQQEDLVDMARRTLAARNEPLALRPTWRAVFDTSMAGEVLLPGDDARIAPTSFDDWITAGAR